MDADLRQPGTPLGPRRREYPQVLSAPASLGARRSSALRGDFRWGADTAGRGPGGPGAQLCIRRRHDPLEGRRDPLEDPRPRGQRVGLPLVAWTSGGASRGVEAGLPVGPARER